jgi:hypothetical protein
MVWAPFPWQRLTVPVQTAVASRLVVSFVYLSIARRATEIDFRLAFDAPKNMGDADAGDRGTVYLSRAWAPRYFRRKDLFGTAGN